MAKFGEGDQRWIVNDRQDGRNVNSWHWEERDQTDWAKCRLRELLADLVVREDSGMAVKVLKVDSITGEVTLQSRKQRKFALYELDLKVKWEAQLFDGDGKTAEETKGTLRVEDLSEESLSDLPIELVCDDESGRKRELKEVMRKQGAALVKDKCAEFVKELKALVAAGQSGDAAVAAKPAEVPVHKERSNNTYVVSAADAKQDTGRVTVNYDFSLPRMFVYESLLDANRMRAATAADATVEAKPGGQIRLFNGSVEGEVMEMVPGEKIVQKWRFNTWQPGHFSQVTITLAEDGGNTKLKLVQTGVPMEEKDRTEKGWRVMIFDRLKMVLGGVPP